MNRGNHHRASCRSAALVGAAWAAVALVIVAFFDIKAAASGWLIGFVFWAQILLGSLTLLMIYRLTGGRWGEMVAPAVAPAATTVPLLILIAVPLFVALPLLYPWAHRPDAIKPDVLSYYLNTPSYIVRTLIALFGWSALALLLPRTFGLRGQLLAALGLVFHALVVSSVAIDWYLSLEAPFNSSSFGASVAIASLAAALALAASVAPMPEGDPAIGDVGGLLLATILGLTYIDFMTVLVIWYGDLPNEEIWFVEREPALWTAIAVAAFVLVSLVPIFALLLGKIRNARAPLRAVGIGVLSGLALYDVYLIAPPAGGMAALAALFAIAGIGLALTGILLSGVTTPDILRELADAR